MFASCGDEAHETAVDAVERVLYQKALCGDTVAMIGYLKAHAAKFDLTCEVSRLPYFRGRKNKRLSTNRLTLDCFQGSFRTGH